MDLEALKGMAIYYLKDLFRLGREDFNQITTIVTFPVPGPDGFQPIFFQKCWHIVGSKVLNVALKCLNEGNILKEINEMLIVLIPKVSALKNLQHFCPISLCNVGFKAITKALANRLKPFLPKVVAPTHSSVIHGRNIFDNIIMYQEVLHSFQSRKGSKADMLIKLDLIKAYDKLKWSFVYDTLQHLSVPEMLIRAIMVCFTSPSFRILWNGEKRRSLFLLGALGKETHCLPIYLFYA